MVTDLTGQRFGRRVVLEFADKDKRGAARWKVLCDDCGVTKIVRGDSLRSGCSKSCGCLSKHGYARRGCVSPLYIAWKNMKDRCYNPNNKHYSSYGGRGIKVCDRWIESFKNFLEDIGPRPIGTSLGRKGDVGNYEKSNCAWMTSKEQQQNWRPDRNMGFIKKKSVAQIAA